jgi:hypothetical protein
MAQAQDRVSCAFGSKNDALNRISCGIPTSNLGVAYKNVDENVGENVTYLWTTSPILCPAGTRTQQILGKNLRYGQAKYSHTARISQCRCQDKFKHPYDAYLKV